MAPTAAAAIAAAGSGSSSAYRQAVFGEPVCVVRWLTAVDVGFRTADSPGSWNMFCIGSGQSLSIQRERPKIGNDDDDDDDDGYNDDDDDAEPGRMVLEEAHKWTLSSSVRAAAVLPLQSSMPGHGADGEEEYHIACACSRGSKCIDLLSASSLGEARERDGERDTYVLDSLSAFPCLCSCPDFCLSVCLCVWVARAL